MTDLSKISVVSWVVGDIKPYENNHKIHSTMQIEKLAASISRFGWDQPIVVDAGGVIVKGHGRYAAALHLGMKKVPVVVCDHLSEKEVAMARIQDNLIISNDIDKSIVAKEAVDHEMANDDLFVEVLDYAEMGLGKMEEQIDEFDPEPISDDVTDDVETMISDNVEEEAIAAKGEVQLFRSLGFSKIPADQEINVKRYVARIKHETGEEDSRDAFLTVVKEAVE